MVPPVLVTRALLREGDTNALAHQLMCEDPCYAGHTEIEVNRLGALRQARAVQNTRYCSLVFVLFGAEIVLDECDMRELLDGRQLL